MCHVAVYRQGSQSSLGCGPSAILKYCLYNFSTVCVFLCDCNEKDVLIHRKQLCLHLLECYKPHTRVKDNRYDLRRFRTTLPTYSIHERVLLCAITVFILRF